MIETTIDLLGRKGTDRVTGYSGVITTVTFDLYGCIQVILTPAKGADGKMGELHWFDVNRIEIAKGKRVMPRPAFAPMASHQDYEKGPAAKPAPASGPR